MDVLTRVEPERIDRLLRGDEFFWLDLVDPSDDVLDALAAQLGLHPLAVEDSKEFGQRPKVDRYRDAVLLVYYTALVADGDRLPELLEVHCHVSGGWLLTVRRKACAELDRLHETLVPHEVAAEDFIVYSVLDSMTDALYPAIDRLEATIDGLEARVLARPDRPQLAEIYRIKQDVHGFLRPLVAQRDQVGTAGEAIHELPGLTHGSREYMRDVADHLAQVVGELNRQAEDLNALTSTYFNANTNRLNITITRLTVVATFFLIWTLVTSFFGQNFGWLVRHIDTPEAFVGYGIGGLLLPTAAAGVYFWRRRREWR
ncbi:MAG TPA: magnesium transporter CorA family protein [Solirubrobacteraceae bacterium]|nr:magnesium transporter CorA family protein [Solirubrobacteraceae bacterium]